VGKKPQVGGQTLKTPYVLLTFNEYNAMIAALIAYQEQHQEMRDEWQKQNNLDCTCRACQYASVVQTNTAVTPAPIFMPPSLPWPDETSQSSGGTHGHTAAISAIGGSPDE